MTKAEFITQLARKLNVSKKMAAEICSIAFSEIANLLKKGGKITLPGFGTFGTRSRAARLGRNPATGATIKIPAAKVAYFRSGEALKNKIAGKTRKAKKT